MPKIKNRKLSSEWQPYRLESYQPTGRSRNASLPEGAAGADDIFRRFAVRPLRDIVDPEPSGADRMKVTLPIVGTVMLLGLWKIVELAGVVITHVVRSSTPL